MVNIVTPTTELEAVNECLAAINQSPVNSISGDIGVDAELALQLVRAISRELQVRGFYWNTEKDMKLTPNADGDILLPANLFYIDPTGVDADRDYVARGRRLYDRTNHRYTFTEPVYVDMVIGLGFDELPEAARRYVALRAARKFQERVDGISDQADQQDEFTAYADLLAEDLRVSDHNMLTDNPTNREMLRRFTI